MKGIIDFLKKLFKKIFKAIKKAIGWIMKNWKILALAFVLAVMFLTPAFLTTIGAGWLSGSAALVQSTLGVSSGWGLWAGVAAAGGAAIIIAPSETAKLVTGIAENVAEVGGAVGSGASEIISTTIGGILTGVVSGTTSVITETLKAVVFSPATWVVAGLLGVYLLWPSKKEEAELDEDTNSSSKTDDGFASYTEPASDAEPLVSDQKPSITDEPNASVGSYDSAKFRFDN